MTIAFTEISLGVALMDREHRALVALFDAFERCFGDDSQLEEAERLAGEALSLANDHFEHEEALMAESQYPGIAEHKFHHRNLRLQFTTLVDDTIANIRRHDPVTLEHLDVMRRLLQEHILGPDTVLAAHLKTVSAQSERAEPTL
ncbi:MAG: hemerythrin domain-containing protein [Rhizomicrobium sp.]|nr:hemerythrin domain-containing protein [Rhizomicrobium sp.]